MLSLLLAGTAWGIEPSLGTPSGILVLRNGQLLRGDIVHLGDRYQVTLAGGGEIRIPIAAVEMHCRDLADAYAKKNAAAERGSVAQRLDLAEWCLRHDLTEQAAEQLSIARRRDPEHPRLAALERRLNAPPLIPEANRSPSKAGAAPVTLDDLEQAMRDLPPGSVESFTTVIQPLLVNRCGAHGCHGAGSSSEFRVFRSATGQTLTRRFTQRNLYSALAMVDRRAPSESRLLTVVRAPHGTASAAIFSERESGVYQQLVQWVAQATGPKQTSPPSLAPRKASLLQTTEPPRSPAEASSDDAPQSDAPPNKTPPGESPSAAAAVGQREAAGRQRFVPRDAFDPEIFNRRYVAKDQVADAVPTTTER